MELMAAPGVRVEMVDPPPPTQPGRVDVLGLVAVCERGPADVPIRISSWRMFTDIFGFFLPNGLGAYTAKAFFDNGGSLAHVVRVAAPEHSTTLTGAQPADRTQSVVAVLDGLVAGGSATISGVGTRVHQHLVVAIDPVADKVTWDRPLDPELDPLVNGPITVLSGAGVARAAFSDAAGNPALVVAAAGPGSAGNRLTVRVTGGRRTATITTGAGTAAALPVFRIDGFTAGSLVRFTQTSPAPITQWCVLAGVDGVTQVLLVDPPLPTGPGGFDLNSPISCETDSFTLTVSDRGRLLEVHPDLVLVPRHPRWALGQVQAASRLIRLELPAGGLPAVPSHPVAAQPSVAGDPATAGLTGGRDGTAGMIVADLIGDDLIGNGRGLAALTDLPEPALIAIPDLVAGPVAAHVMLPPQQPDPCDPCAPPALPVPVTTARITEAGAVFDDEAIATAQQLLIEHCERLGDRMALLDPPAGRAALDAGRLRGWRARFDSSYAALYAPWVSVIDPLATSGGSGSTGGSGGSTGQNRRLPPSGHIAGLIAGSDADTGPWRAPANRPLQWAVAVDTDFDDAAHALLNGDGVNLLRPKPARGVICLGARTVSSDPAWRNLNVRRLFLYARRVLSGALAWAVFEPLDARLIALTDTVLAGFAEGLYAAGALAGDSAAEAYQIRFDRTDPLTGVLDAELALAAARPNEFLLLRVARTEDRLEFADSTAARAGSPGYPALPLTGTGTP